MLLGATLSLEVTQFFNLASKSLRIKSLYLLFFPFCVFTQTLLQPDSLAPYATNTPVFLHWVLVLLSPSEKQPSHPTLLTSLPFLPKYCPLLKVQHVAHLFPEAPVTPYFRK